MTRNNPENGSILLPESQLALVKKILLEFVPGVKVCVFGSRARDKCKPFSDLDLVVMDEMPVDADVIYRLKDAFDESDLPIRVDVVDWHAISGSFQNEIQKHCVTIQPGSNP